MVHKCLEIYCGGVLPPDQILEYYDSHFDDYCQTWFPEEKREQYYLQGYEYLQHIENNLPLVDYEILGIEKKLSFELKEFRDEYRDESGKLPSYQMTGFIDLLLKNKNSGEIEIRDHKSSTMRFSKKTGQPYKSDAEHWKAFQRQLYLYSYPLVESGVEVTSLSWNMFRSGVIKVIPWVKEDYDEAVTWALDQIHLLEKEEEFAPKEDFFYCKNLCGYRDSCFVANQKNDAAEEFM